MPLVNFVENHDASECGQAPESSCYIENYKKNNRDETAESRSNVKVIGNTSRVDFPDTEYQTCRRIPQRYRADIPTEADEDHIDPTDTKEAGPTAEASQPEQIRLDNLEEIRPPPPFPKRLKKHKQDYQFKKFFDILKQVHINLPLVDALQQMPNYAKFLKDMVSMKRRIGEFETATATETCLVLMHNKVPAKKTDPGSFTIECFIGHNYSTKALCDPGPSINLMPKSVFQKLDIGEEKPTIVMLQLADHSFVQPEGKIEDILVQIDKFIFPADFLILDCEADENANIILGRPFLASSRTVIDFDKDEIAFQVDNDQVKMKVFTSPGQLKCKGRNKAIPNTQHDYTK
ncbi:hypothetical protein V6N12_062184 [Hibiscus sabdariffa]|uniref:Uncharacterized protein n=1 Tax=Hibiscus sabdariffa TaxID=183260 RepID=A0ABR2F897_9ROSI